MDEEKIKEKFEEIYKTKLKTKVEKLERDRIEVKKKYDLFKILSITFFVLSILSFILTTINNNPEIYICIFLLSLLAAIILLVLSIKILNDFRKKAKQNLLKPILALFGSFSLAQNELITLKEIKDMGLHHISSSKFDDDNITGTYKGVPVTMIETKLTHTVTCGKSTRTITDFSGLIFKIRINNGFNGIIIGAQNQDPMKSISTLTNVANNPVVNTILDATSGVFSTDSTESSSIFGNKVTKILDKITLEDFEAGNLYNIYTNNQLEARRLLSKTFFEKIKNIRNTLIASAVDFVFKDNYLHLFICGNNTNVNEMILAVHKKRYCTAQNGFFEVGGISVTLLNKEIYLKAFRELLILFSLIDSFVSEEKIEEK